MQQLLGSGGGCGSSGGVPLTAMACFACETSLKVHCTFELVIRTLADVGVCVCSRAKETENGFHYYTLLGVGDIGALRVCARSETTVVSLAPSVRRRMTHKRAIRPSIYICLCVRL